MKQSKRTGRKATLHADSQWVAQMAQAVKEDQQVIQELAERINERNKENQSLDEQVKDIIKNAEFGSQVIATDDCLSMSTMAKDLGMSSATRLQNELMFLDIIYRQGGYFHMTDRFSGLGLGAYKKYKDPAAHDRLYWTQKGRQWLHNLAKRGILMVEPRPREKKQEKPTVPVEVRELPNERIQKPVKNTEMLMNLIEQMQGYFECIVSLAKDCIKDNDEQDRRLLLGDIRSINDSTSIMMRKLESECYKMLS